MEQISKTKQRLIEAGLIDMWIADVTDKILQQAAKNRTEGSQLILDSEVRTS